MMIGNIGGCIGETSAILLLLGGVYLMYKGIINYVIPVFYIATVFILTFLLGGFNITFAIYQLFAGGLMLGGFFMLTDYTTSPMTKRSNNIRCISWSYNNCYKNVWWISRRCILLNTISELSCSTYR